MDKDFLRCALVTMAPFPVGNVSTMRFSSYMQSLSKKGFASFVLVYCPTTMAKHIHSRSGNYCGIRYQYATKITWKTSWVIEKFFYLILGLVKSWYYLKKEKINTVILYGDNLFFVTLFFATICRLHNIRFVGDRSELPLLRVRNSILRKKIYEIKQLFFDGIIVMTKKIKEYYIDLFRCEKKIFFLPMTIDPKRFSNVVKESVAKPYIAVVFGTHNRDGLEESIKAFAEYKNVLNGTFDLLLVGDYANMPNKEKLDSLILEHGLKKHIEIRGKVPNNLVPQILKNASCLLTTPNFYVSGGFPTKLGEYMLSGTPIVATKTGELSDYIEPGKEMLFSLPGDTMDIAKNIKFIEDNPEKGRLLSKNAYDKSSVVFNSETYLDGLVSFLKGI